MNISQSGITTAGLPVIARAFSLVGTHFIPLEVVLGFLQEWGLVMDWPDDIAGALADGHKPRTIRGRVLAAVGDAYGPIHATEVAKRMDAYLELGGIGQAHRNGQGMNVGEFAAK